MSPQAKRTNRKPKRNFGALHYICLMFSLLFLLSSVVGYFDPDPFWVLSFFGLFYTVFLFLNILAFVYWVTCLSLYSLLPVVFLLIGWGTFTNVYGFATRAEPEVGKVKGDLRVMTYNAHSFKRFGAKHESDVRTKMLDLLRTQQPDVLCFQEFYTRRKGKYYLLDSVKKILSAKGYYFEPAMQNEFEGVGLAIFSKYPIKNKGLVTFEKQNVNGCMWVDVDVRGQRLRVFNVHLASIGLKKEDYAYLNGQARNEKSSSKRIGSRIKRAFVKRSKQVSIVRNLLEETTTPYIVAGDFNDTPNSFAVKRIGRDLVNTFSKKGSGFGVTYDTFLLDFQIDYVFVTKDFWVRNYCVIDQKLSDHYAVRTDISLEHDED